MQLVHSSADIIMWTSEDTSVVAIDMTGTVTVIGSGTVQVAAVDSAGEQYSIKLVIADDEIMLGDADGDAIVGLSDASDALAYYANIAVGNDVIFGDTQEEHERLFRCADVNSDGVITLQDAAYILIRYARAAASLPADWELILVS